MGWNSSTQILTAPFTKIALNGQGDLQNALGRQTSFSEIQLVGDVNASSADVGAINMWAKYKPFRSTTAVYTFDSSQSTPALRSPDRWAAALNANYGIAYTGDSTMGNPTNSNHFAYKLLAGTAPWYYNKPVLNTNPLRALDFDGYYAGALTLTPQPSSATPPSYMIAADNSLTVSWLSSYASSDVEQLQYTDLTLNGVTLDQCYFGMLLFNPSNNAYAFVAPNKISTGNFDVKFPLTQAQVANFRGYTCKIVPFVCTKQVSLNVEPSSPRYASWNCTPIDINVLAHSGNFDANLSASWNAIGGTTVNYTLTVSNSSGSVRNATQIYIVLTSGSASGTIVAQAGPISISSIPAGGSKSTSGSFSNLTYATNLYITARSTATTDPIPETSTQVRLPIDV